MHILTTTTTTSLQLSVTLTNWIQAFPVGSSPGTGRAATFCVVTFTIFLSIKCYQWIYINFSYTSERIKSIIVFVIKYINIPAVDKKFSLVVINFNMHNYCEKQPRVLVFSNLWVWKWSARHRRTKSDQIEVCSQVRFPVCNCVFDTKNDSNCFWCSKDLNSGAELKNYTGLDSIVGCIFRGEICLPKSCKNHFVAKSHRSAKSPSTKMNKSYVWTHL